MRASRRVCLGVSVLVALASSTPTIAIAQSRTAPKTYVYEVKAGDTLLDVADRYLVARSDYHQVQRLNRIRNPRQLRINQRLVLPVRLLRTEIASARLGHYRGDVSLDTGSGPVSPLANQSVPEGTIIATGRNAFLRLSFSDGTSVVIPSNSRVRLKTVRRYVINNAVEHDIEVLSGRLESRVSPTRFPGGYRVTTPVSVSAVRGTEFRIAVNDGETRAATEVLEGRVEVDATGTREDFSLVADEALAVAEDQAVRAVLLPAPALADPIGLHLDKTVTIGIAPLEGADRYRVRLAKDAGLMEVIAEHETRSGQTELDLGPLPDGLYYVSLSAVSLEEIEGRNTVYSLTRIEDYLSELKRPGLTDARLRAYHFRWEPEPTGPGSRRRAPRYHFTLHSAGADGQPSGPALFERSNLTRASVDITGLSPGVYIWQARTQGDRESEPQEAAPPARILHIGR